MSFLFEVVYEILPPLGSSLSALGANFCEMHPSGLAQGSPSLALDGWGLQALDNYCRQQRPACHYQVWLQEWLSIADLAHMVKETSQFVSLFSVRNKGTDLVVALHWLSEPMLAPLTLFFLMDWAFW